MVIPGNALAVDAEKPYKGLEKFGLNFLNRFQGSQVPAPILEDITFIDTPGVLSGEKQRIGRNYDFVGVVEVTCCSFPISSKSVVCRSLRLDSGNFSFFIYPLTNSSYYSMH